MATKLVLICGSVCFGRSRENVLNKAGPVRSNRRAAGAQTAKEVNVVLLRRFQRNTNSDLSFSDHLRFFSSSFFFSADPGRGDSGSGERRRRESG